ncbi:MAG: hypothetical protein ABSC03_09360 [Verrucomicrobiota bacterium]
MNKDDERYYLSEFLKLMPEFQGLKPIDSEGPDFLCDVLGILTGIELTRFFFPTAGRLPPQAAEAYRSRLASELREEHLKTRVTPVHVSVHIYRDDALFKPRQRTALKKELFAFVSHRIPPSGPYVEFDSESLSKSLCEKGVDAIMILHNAKLTTPYWSVPYASVIPESSSSIVQGIIGKKDRLVPKYRKKADKLWLLILSGTDGLHSTVYFDNDVLTHRYATDFDRVFLFRTFGACAHELRRV